MREFKFTTKSEFETFSLGNEISSAILESQLKNFIVLLCGELGTGKTTFTQGIARGINSTDVVQSPTFVFLQTHKGIVSLYHFDLYRINNPSELDELGFFELIDRDGIVVIEWGEKVENFIDGDMKVTFNKLVADTREIVVTVYNDSIKDLYRRRKHESIML